MPVLLAIGIAGLVVLGAYAGSGALTLAVLGAQAVLAYGLVGARALPDQMRSGLLVLATGAGAVLALQLADPDPLGPSVESALWVLGPGVVLALVLALTRRDGRDRLVETTATTVTAVALAGMLALVVPLEALTPLGATAVALAAGGVVAGVAIWWLAAAVAPTHRWLGAVLATAATVAAAATLVLVEVPGLEFEERLVAGAAVAVTGLVGSGAGSRLADEPVRRAVLMPVVGLALTGPAAYVATLMLLG